MAYADIQNKVGQIQMANRILLAQRMDPNKTPETDLSGFQEQGGYAPEEVDVQPVDGPNKINFRKQIYPDYKGNRRGIRRKKGRFEGMTDDQIREVIAKEDAQRAKEAEEARLDQDPELNKQREDMRQGDYLEDPENPLSDLLKIGAGAAGFGGNILRMLINPLGGNALASTPQDGRTPTRLFYNNPYPDSRPDVFIKDEQMKKDAKKRFKLNTGINLAGAQDIDTKMHILPSGMMVDENGIKYIWSPREQMFKDMGPYDPYYDGLPIPMGQRNSEMKIYG